MEEHIVMELSVTGYGGGKITAHYDLHLEGIQITIRNGERVVHETFLSEATKEFGEFLIRHSK